MSPEYVKVRPQLFERPDDVTEDPIWRVTGRHGRFVEVMWVWPMTSAQLYLGLPMLLGVTEDDVIRCDPPAPKPSPPRDPITGLTLEEAARLYRQRCQQAAAGDPMTPCIGWDDAHEVFVTPHGPITMECIRAFEGRLLSSVPDGVRIPLTWLCDFLSPSH